MIVFAIFLGAADILLFGYVFMIRVFGKETEAEYNGYPLDPGELPRVPKFSFNDENGKHTTVKYMLACPFINYKQGQKLKAYYMPKNTDRVIIWDASLIYLFAEITLGCAVFIIITLNDLK